MLNAGWSAAVGGDPVAGAADGLDRVAPERMVDFLAQVADVDLDDVRVAVEMRVPDVLQDGGLGRRLPGAAQQELQHGELARGDGDRCVAAGYPAGRRVERQIAGCEDRRAL